MRAIPSRRAMRITAGALSRPPRTAQDTRSSLGWLSSDEVSRGSPHGRMMRRALRVALVAAILLQACAVGPNYRRPPAPLPASVRGPGVVPPESPADVPWWEVFHDDQLSWLIAETLRNNYDLQTAVSRVEQARGVLITTRSAIFPQATYQGAAGQGKEFFGFESNRFLKTFAATFNFSWEIDLWGRIRRATESSRADLLATYV